MEFIQLLESVGLCFCHLWEVFSHYFFECFFSLLLSVWNANDKNIITFLIVPQALLVLLCILCFFDATFYFFICFHHVCNCSLKYLMKAALKSLSYNSNITAITVLVSVDCQYLFNLIQIVVFFVLRMMVDFELKSEPFRYYIMRLWILLNLLF